MNFYKETANSALTHNGKKYAKGDVVRERVPLTSMTLRALKNTPEITNCTYTLIGKSNEEEKAYRKDLFAKARILVEEKKFDKMPAFSIKTPELEKLIKEA